MPHVQVKKFPFLNETVAQLNQTSDTLNTTNIELQQTISETQRLANIAFSRQLAAQSSSELSQGDYEPAILLAIEAGRVTDTLEAFSAIRAAIANPGHSRLVFYGHTDAVSQATWSRDGSKILTRSDDTTVRIWDAATGAELVKLEDPTNVVYQATWSQVFLANEKVNVWPLKKSTLWVV